MNKIFEIKPHKNWFAIILSIPILVGCLLFVILYFLQIYYERQYFLLPFLLLIIGIAILVIKQLIWTFVGKIEIGITKKELNISKIKLTSTITKSYYLEEIEDLKIKNLYALKTINSIPLFGSIYLSLINTSKKDSESIVINYRGKEIEILNHLKIQEAESILKEVNSFFISLKCSPVVGSSKINKMLPWLLPLPKNEASLTR